MKNQSLSLRRRFARLPILGALFALGACASHPPMPTVPAVDLERFMGDWFVIEAIPASSEREAYNGVESYRMREDGQIATTYAFRDGGFDGKLKVMEPVGCVDNKTTNATWGMQFFWPFHAEYLIVYLNPEYTETIIGRTKRDYVWIMARTPDLPAARLEALEAEVERLGYDRTKLRRVPQRWPDPGHPYSAPTR